MRTMIKRFSLTHFATAAMVVSAGLMVAAMLTPRPSLAAKGGKSGGGGNETTPATITFLNDFNNHELLGNDGPYVDGVNGLEVFIGSAANEGNIRIKGLNANPIRTLNITVPGDDTCGLPTMVNVDLESLKVDAASVLSGGIFSIAQGESAAIPMSIRFAHDGDFFSLNSTPRKKVPVRTRAAAWCRSSARVRRVGPSPMTALPAWKSTSQKARMTCASAWLR